MSELTNERTSKRTNEPMNERASARPRPPAAPWLTGRLGQLGKPEFRVTSHWLPGRGTKKLQVHRDAQGQP